MRVAFLGFGVYGNAIASLLDYNKITYDYTRRSDQQPLNGKVDVLFIAVPAQAVRSALLANRNCITRDTVIINCAKGIEQDSHKLVFEIVAELHNTENYYSLSGPSFANELNNRMPTSVSLGYHNATHVPMIKDILETPYFKIEEDSDYRTIELAGAMKNVYAIVCGYSSGVGFDANTRALIVLNALREIKQLASAMFEHEPEILQPAVVGDLMLTCNSTQSRNFQYGMSIASGEYEVGGKTIEGYYTSQSVSYLSGQYDVTLPIADLASKIINHEIVNEESFRDELIKQKQLAK